MENQNQTTATEQFDNLVAQADKIAARLYTLIEQRDTINSDIEKHKADLQTIRHLINGADLGEKRFIERSNAFAAEQDRAKAEETVVFSPVLEPAAPAPKPKAHAAK
jgi:uncharacterized coiled-coil DUF342 family protein